MIRPFAALALFALCFAPALAQETAPADIVVDPTATFNNSPRQANMLTGFYATQAVIELCVLPIAPDIVAGMAVDRTRLETALGLDTASAATAYDKVRADVERTGPDCAEGSADRRSVDAVTAIYAGLAAPAATQ